MKKRSLLVVLCVMMSGMCGCGMLPSLPDLTEEQNAVITEYAAGLMLKYDKNDLTRNLSDEELVKGEQEEAEARAREERLKQSAEEYLRKKEAAKMDKASNEDKESSDSGSKEEKVEKKENVIDDIAGFVGMDEFSVRLSGYDLMDSYPEAGRADDILSVTSSQGKDLLLLKFDVTNTSSADADFDMFAKKAAFSITFGDGSRIAQEMTLLLDDMSAYKGIITAGSSENMVLIFEVDEGFGDIAGSKLNVIYNGEAAVLPLQ
ncbi:MAG: hypothetical protein K5662_04190 [Lachnospiraceae bacterium]|nr:hypothetical protein [Lachnospiraceae bacterium]